MVALDRTELPFWSHYQRFTVATFNLLDSRSQNALRGLVGGLVFLTSHLTCSVLVRRSPDPAPYKLMQRFQQRGWLSPSRVDNTKV